MYKIKLLNVMVRLGLCLVPTIAYLYHSSYLKYGGTDSIVTPNMTAFTVILRTLYN